MMNGAWKGFLLYAIGRNVVVTQRLAEDDTNGEVTEKLEGGADIYANSGSEDSLINSITPP